VTLECGADNLNLNGWKPKWMHWKTFDRLVEEHDVYIDLSLKEMTKKHGEFGFW
jgi:hypothetical protein